MDTGTDTGIESGNDVEPDTASNEDADSGTSIDADAGNKDVIFHVRSIEAKSSKAMAGVQCELLDETGAALNPPVTVVSKSDGVCQFGLFSDRQSFSAKLTTDGYLDGYVFHRIGRPMDDEGGAWGMTVRLFTAAEVAELENQLGIAGEAGVDGGDAGADGGDAGATGTIRGDVWWSMIQPVHAVGSGKSVACAEITPLLDNTFYNNGTTNMPDPALTSTTAQGGWMTFRVPAGSLTLTATVAGASEQTGLITVFPNSVTYPTATFLQEKYPKNPSPGTCN